MGSFGRAIIGESEMNLYFRARRLAWFGRLGYLLASSCL